MSEKMTDHYPRKKRRLCLTTNKTPNRQRNSTIRSDLNGSKNLLPTPMDIQMSLKNQRKLSISPSCQHLSSDESCLEIGWDNNSPSPTTVLRNGKVRRNTRQKPSDLCNLLKVLPKKKHSCDIKEVDDGQDDHLSTWMQENLASSAVMQDLVKKNTNRRSHMKRSLKSLDAKDFNEQLKKFMEISKQKDVNQIHHTNCRRSPRISMMQKNTSPNMLNQSQSTSINQSQSDSLLMMENFDELLIADQSIKVGDKENEPTKNKLVMKTPNNPKRKSKLLKTPKTSTWNCSPNSRKTRFSRVSKAITNNKPQSTMTSFLKSIKEPDKQAVCSSIEMDDELDDILSSQIELIHDKKNLKTENTSQPSDPPKVIDLTLEEEEEEEDSIEEGCLPKQGFTKVKHNQEHTDGHTKRSLNLAAKRKHMSTPKLFKTDSGLLQTTTGLVTFDDDNMFDDVLMSLDDELKCKSQETPPRVTEDQRKLKTRSHTSPFPLNKKCKLVAARNSINNNNNNKIITNNENPKFTYLPTPLQTNFIPIPSNNNNINPSKRQCVDSSNNFVTSTIISDRCRRPFKPPNQGVNTSISTEEQLKAGSSYCTRKGLAFKLDLSIISKDSTTRNCVETDDPVINVKTDSSTKMQLSSTQRCSYSDIERKRKEAQTRLKQRLRRKK